MADLKDMFGAAGESGTFLGLPKGDVSDAAAAPKADIVIMGADCATPYASVGAYCAGGPDAIRAGSADYAGDTRKVNFDLLGPLLPDGIRAVDAGNLSVDPLNAPASRGAIRQAIGQVLQAGAVPVLLGGDDSLPIPILEAMAPAGPLTILQIDAHIDWRDEVDGERLGLSSTMRRASEMEHVVQIIQVGARGVGSAGMAELEAARDWGAVIIPAHDMPHGGLDRAIDLIPEGGQIALCIDCDALDPSIMPAVIAPTAGGLTYAQALYLIRGAAARGRIAAVDLVEFMPERDQNGAGAVTAAQLLTTILGLIGRQVANPRSGCAV
ncbi:arginase family protein [Phaeobacter marinintestinus]|uniref:arginase family protein n=1 Tax=Falsiphaeobacter marinintestinus TaxID=1492905 RepID=UPI0011B5797A|nr:arginase family protein [Phaeobacter marinintestinus]